MTDQDLVKIMRQVRLAELARTPNALPTHIRQEVLDHMRLNYNIAQTYCARLYDKELL